MNWQLQDISTAERFIREYEEIARDIPAHKLVPTLQVVQKVVTLAEAVTKDTPLLSRLDPNLNHHSLLSFAKKLESFLFSNVSELFHDMIRLVFGEAAGVYSPPVLMLRGYDSLRN